MKARGWIKLVQEGRMTSYLKKNIVGQGTSWSHEAGSSRTSNKIIGQGRSWSHEAGPEDAKTTKIWGRVRAGPRRQDQLVPQKNCSAGYELVLSGRMSSYLKKHVLCRAQRKFVRQGTSWSQKAGLARTTKNCLDAGSARTRRPLLTILMSLAQCLRKLTVDLCSLLWK